MSKIRGFFNSMNPSVPPGPSPPVPVNCKRLGRVTPKLATAARGWLTKLSIGQSAEQEIEGLKYVFQAEYHFNEPPAIPTGWHKGISVYEVIAPPKG